MASVTDELNFLLYLILIYLNLNSYMWLVVTMLDRSRSTRIYVEEQHKFLSNAEPDWTSSVCSSLSLKQILGI